MTDDLHARVASFLDRFAKDNGKAVTELAPETLAAELRLGAPAAGAAGVAFSQKLLDAV